MSQRYEVVDAEFEVHSETPLPPDAPVLSPKEKRRQELVKLRSAVVLMILSWTLSVGRAWLIATRFWPWFVTFWWPKVPAPTTLMVLGLLFLHGFVVAEAPTKKDDAKTDRTPKELFIGRLSLTLYGWFVLWLVHLSIVALSK